MFIKPILDRVLVKPLEEDKTKGGLIIPKQSRETPTQGLVVAIGPGRIKSDGSVQTFDFKVGDKVIYNSFVGLEVPHEGVKYLMMKEEDIEGVVE